MNSAELLTGLERCPRIPWWGAKWKPAKLKPIAMIEAGVMAGLTEQTRTDIGELAGEEVYLLGSEPGIDSKQYDQHSEVVHLACIADAVATAIRPSGSEPWKHAPNLPNWQSGCWLSPDGTHLRRVEFVSSWSDDRHYATLRSWAVLGEVCWHNLPMQLVVVHLGAHRDGRYHSYWSHCQLHPSGVRTPRFRKKNDVETPFKGSWIPAWREDRDDISTIQWLDAMLQDHVLEDLCRRVDISVPKPEQRQMIIDLAQRKLDLIRNTKELPDQNLSTCWWPTQCVFRQPCHAQQEPSGAWGFVQIAP